LSLFGENLADEKNRRFVTFLGRFLSFWTPISTYTDLSKNRPHKKHCAWARTPPWEFGEIYRKNPIFHDFGAFNRAGKSVTKIGIYALPPLKTEFYRQFMRIYRFLALFGSAKWLGF
jgi:hypothetical protein